MIDRCRTPVGWCRRKSKQEKTAATGTWTREEVVRAGGPQSVASSSCSRVVHTFSLDFSFLFLRGACSCLRFPRFFGVLIGKASIYRIDWNVHEQARGSSIFASACLRTLYHKRILRRCIFCCRPFAAAGEYEEEEEKNGNKTCKGLHAFRFLFARSPLLLYAYLLLLLLL